MRLSPHQVLASLADHERKKAEDTLMAMAAKRRELQQQLVDVEDKIIQLSEQRQQAGHATMQAATLMMMDSAMLEQRQHVVQIQLQIEKMKAEEQQVLQHWVAAHQKNKSHQKMIESDEKKIQRLKDRRVQQQMDDVYASRHGRKV